MCPGGPAGHPDDPLQPIGRVAWDLRLYVVCPLAGLMETDRDRRSFQEPWFLDLQDINLDNEDPGADETTDGPAPGTRPAGTLPVSHGTGILRSRVALQCRSGRSLL